MDINSFFEWSMWGSVVFATCVGMVGIIMELVYTEFQIIKKIPKIYQYSIFSVIWYKLKSGTYGSIDDFGVLTKSAMCFIMLWISIVLVCSIILVFIALAYKLWWLILPAIIGEQIWRRKIIDVDISVNRKEKEDEG